MAVSELDDLSEAIGLAAKVDYALLAGSEVEASAEVVQRLKAQLAALEAEVVGAYDASLAWASGSASFGEGGVAASVSDARR